LFTFIYFLFLSALFLPQLLLPFPPLFSLPFFSFPSSPSPTFPPLLLHPPYSPLTEVYYTNFTHYLNNSYPSAIPDNSTFPSTNEVHFYSHMNLVTHSPLTSYLTPFLLLTLFLPLLVPSF
jgi:hypothetical protein